MVFINPNFHVILVHLPLGIFVLGVLIELFSFMYRRSTLRLAGRWMILLGALATIPAAFTGIYALNDIAQRSQADGLLPEHAPWAQVAANARLGDVAGDGSTHLATNPLHNGETSAQTAEAWHFFHRHAWLEGSASALVALTAVLFLGLSDRMRRRLYFPALVLMLAGTGLMAVGAWYSGESIYRFGSATRLQKTQPAASTAESAISLPPPATAPSAMTNDATPADPAFAVSPLPQLPPYDSAQEIVVSPTSEPATAPTTEPSATTVPATTGPTTAPGQAAPSVPPVEPPTTAPSTGSTPAPAPTTNPAPESAPTTVPAPERTTSAPPATAPTTETTLPTSVPAVVIPPPTVPPAGVVRPLGGPATAPAVVAPPTAAVVVPVPAISPPHDEENKTEKVGSPAYFVGPPLQIHVLLAGLSVAIALAALGASMRRLALLEPPPVTEAEAALEAEETEAALSANNAVLSRRPVTGQDIDLVRTINPDLTLARNPESVPAARLWLLVFLGVLLTAGVGIYVLAAPRSLGCDGIGLNTDVLWNAISKDQAPTGSITRRLAHAIGGAALLLLPLLLAIFARVSRSRLALGLTSLLLIAVVAAQVWIGILLLYDTNVGTITHFNPAPAASTHVTSPV